MNQNVALISGYRVDKSGNVWYKGTSRNFSSLIATAADTVICGGHADATILSCLECARKAACPTGASPTRSAPAWAALWTWW